MAVMEDFEKLFSQPDVVESQLHTFMEQNTEVIPTPLLLGHDVQWNCVVSQFEIDRDNIADFAYITKNSGNWRFVFIELERPQKRLFIDDPHVDFHGETRKAIAQIEGWKSFAERNREEIVRRFRPLMQPLKFLNNPIDIKYVLIIGRNPEGIYPTHEHSGRIKRLAEESDIHLFTYDSITRMSLAQNVGRPKNVLSHWKDRFAFKVAQANTNIFAHYKPADLKISGDQAAWFESNGYDMKAWSRGELLVGNYKLPESRFDELFDVTLPRTTKES